MAAPQRMGLGEYNGAAIRRRQAHGFVVTENRFAPGLEIPLHEHAYTHFTVILDGGFSETYAGVSLDCPAGSILLVPSGLVHSDTVWASGAHTLGIELSPKLCRRIDDGLGVFKEPRVVSGIALQQKAERLYCEFVSLDSASLLALESLALDILVLASRSLAKSEGPEPQWFGLVMERLHAVGDPPSAGELADLAGIHEAHLARTFRRIHGCTIGEYVRWLRLEDAKERLVKSPDSVAEIAVAAGFYDQAHFSRAFKSAFGTSPSAYRKTFG